MWVFQQNWLINKPAGGFFFIISLRTFVYMLKPGIILPPHPQKDLLGQLSDKGQLHWYVSDNHKTPNLSTSAHVSIYESSIIPLISDVLFVLNPEFCQFEYLTSAIRNSCHLFIDTIDKLTERHQKLLIELAHEAGTQIAVRADRLYTPLAENLTQHNKHPRIVKGEHASSGFQGELFSNITDFIRILLKINQSEITETTVAGGNFLSTKTDFIDVHLNFADGMVASLAFSGLPSNDSSLLNIYRTGSVMRADFLTHKLTLEPKNQTLTFNETDSCENLIRQMNGFLQSIETKEFSVHTLEEEREVFQLVNRIKEQLKVKSISI